jgi:hypothetical protein
LVSLVVFLTSVSTCIFFFTVLSSGIRCKWPNQLNRCAFVVPVGRWLDSHYSCPHRYYKMVAAVNYVLMSY